MKDTRDVFLQRLEKDLIGPFDGLTEALFSKPSDHYLTGILYPKETRIPDSEQEDDDEVFGGKDTGEEGVEQGVSNFRRFRPCTAGISFAIPQTSSKSKICVTIRYGQYAPEATFIPFDPDRPDNPKPDKPLYWQRAQIEEIIEIKLLSETQRIQLSGEGSEHLELFVRMKKLSDRSIVTAQLINTFEPADTDEYEVIEGRSLFQFSITINLGKDEAFYPRKSKASDSDEDNRISNLIFRDVKEYATGHNCSVDWILDNQGECRQIFSTWMPLSKVKAVSHSGDTIFETKISNTSIGSLSAQAMYESPETLIELSTAVSEAYRVWIEDQRNKLENLETEFVEQAKVNLDRCEQASHRILEGIEYLKNHSDALKAFQLANLVMRIQRSWGEGQQDWRTPGRKDLVWRPFQLAFTLMCLASSSERGHPDRNVFDLIWFPTGGGKTEAYLLLSAYVLFLRRMRNTAHQAEGLSVMMRYTLRTLTVQQYERAAAMIAACEVIRSEKYFDILGSTRFSIGLWVGSASTPNKLSDAYSSLNEEANPTSTPAQIKRCPRCRSPIKWKSSAPSSHVSVSCVDETCSSSYPFNDLPFFTVDEQIYAEVPSLLIGTVDKFAQIVRKDKSGNLFGCGSENLPPDLIIQDELHLISGPLGSLTGIYEIAIDELSKTEAGPVKIIGSTATIRRAQEQVMALFDRDVFQFPPAALEADNNGFSKADDNGPGRLYLGLSSAGRSPKFALQAIAASLLQSGLSDDIPAEKRPYYETLVSYYNSLRELGGALVVMQDDVPDSINVIARRRGEDARRLAIPEELTSRKASSEIPDILSALSLDSSQDGFIDVLLASNMLSVGVDIPKLGLMMVNGQPKSMAEYIQATSRVGRTTDGPGLVVTLYNDGKIRDRAHFETFKTWHSALYRSVEASSITPFASRARDKALHAPLIAMARHKLGLKRPRLGESDKQNIQQSLLPLIEKRIDRIDPREKNAALNELLEFLDYWQERSELKSFWNDYGPKQSLLISAEKAAAREASGKSSFDARPTPNSVRNVEPSTLFKVREAVYLSQESNDEGSSDG